MTPLRVEHLRTAYGAVVVNRDVSLTVEQHEIVTILGLNGAGKSTLLWTISGLLRPKDGSIRLDGNDVTGGDAAVVVMQDDEVPPSPISPPLALATMRSIAIVWSVAGVIRPPTLRITAASPGRRPNISTGSTAHALTIPNVRNSRRPDRAPFNPFPKRRPLHDPDWLAGIKA
jgi:ABC-type cobalamin/Fe3+-siderophores transport system ATPase subunit